MPHYESLALRNVRIKAICKNYSGVDDSGLWNMITRRSLVEVAQEIAWSSSHLTA